MSQVVVTTPGPARDTEGMDISARSDYAVRAMLTLAAAADGGTPVSVVRLAAEQGWNVMLADVDLADAAAYPRRSLAIQHQETDLAFVLRLLAEEGLFAWFEHASADDEALGSHTLVIADHNGAFHPFDTGSGRVRYTQAGPTLAELTAQELRRLGVAVRAAFGKERIMRYQISGKQIDIGDSLQGHVKSSLGETVAKYSQRPVDATVIFSRDAHEFQCEAVVHLSTGLTAQAKARDGILTRLAAVLDALEVRRLLAEDVAKQAKRKP